MANRNRPSRGYEVIQKGFVFEDGPTPSCHASTILPLGGGRALAAWFGGDYEKHPNVNIWGAIMENGRWGTPKIWAQSPVAHWNPVLHRMPNGDIWLFYKVGAVIPSWKTMVCVSQDEGRSWSEPRELVPGDEGGRGPVKNKAITLPSGRILAPASTELECWLSFIDISDDHGMSWRRANPLTLSGLAPRPDAEGNFPVPAESYKGRGVIQPTLWYDGQAVHAFMRSSEGRIYRSDSLDEGESWCAPYDAGLPNNNCGLDLDRLPDGRLLLVCNPVDVNWGCRNPISLLLSMDNGESWEKISDLDFGDGEFSYPAAVVEGQDLWISYTWKRKCIAYYRIRFF